MANPAHSLHVVQLPRAEDVRSATRELGSYTPMLRKMALRLSRSPSDADDLVQETYARALSALSGGKAPSRLAPWLVTILKNLHLDECRRRQRRPQTDLSSVQLPAPEPEPVPAWTQVEASQVERALSKLPKEWRAAYELKTRHQKSYDEIAKELGIPRATVGTRILRARRRLRDVLSKELGVSHG